MRQPLVEFDEYIAPDGEMYKFRDGVEKFVISGTNGLGLPRINYRTQRGPFQDGETVLGFVLEPRTLTLIHRHNGCSRQEYWDMRAELLNVTRPNRQSLTEFATGILRKRLPDNSQRDLNVLISSGLQFNDNPAKWDEFSVQPVVQFIAHDPVLFNPIQESASFVNFVALGELVFPITFDADGIVFNSDDIQLSTSVTTVGTYKTFPLIVITGPITNPSITNATINTKIELNTTINAGVIATISLEFGNKTVVDNNGDNLIGFLSTDSDLANFRLEVDPTATDGLNTINVSGSNINENTAITMSWFDRYIGI